VIAVGAASYELGPFIEHSASDSALNLQLYITLAALTTLCLAAVVSERRGVALELAESRVRILAAADAERRRIERDLHDGAQQRLVRLRIRLGLADDLMERDPASARRMIGELEGEIDDCLDDVRSLGAGIYPALLSQRGLAEALRSLARRSSIAPRVAIDGTARYRTEVEAAVYFCCSEALQNVAKHAHGTTGVSISVERHAHLRFEVRDDGPGFSPPDARAGQGLANMRDRIEAVGGTLDVRSTPGQGTSVIGSIASP
jgi:signal transduction histidine kinase